VSKKPSKSKSPPSNPPVAEKPFRFVFGEYSATFSAELEAQKARLDQIIGESHWLSVGRFKEALVRDLLRPFVPKRYEIGTGFVLSRSNKKLLSDEIDVLIWDAQDYFPFFRADDFVIIPPEACRAAIQVKGNLTRKELFSALKNLDSLLPFIEQWCQAKTHVQRSVFAFRMDPKLRFPHGVWDIICRHYERSKMTAAQRAEFTRANGAVGSLPWIRHVACLGAGVIEARASCKDPRASVAVPHFAMQSADVSEGSAGIWVQDLLHALVGHYEAPLTARSLPGITRVLAANARKEVDEQVLILPLSPNPTKREYRPKTLRSKK
jgi:hypothetical protein